MAFHSSKKFTMALKNVLFQSSCVPKMNFRYNPFVFYSIMNHLHCCTSRKLSARRERSAPQTAIKFDTSSSSLHDVAVSLEKNVLFEDDHIIAFNKPHDLPMHGLRDTGSNEGLSVHAALPFITNTADQLTSVFSQNRHYTGVIVLAKTDKAREIYSKYFKDSKINKVKHTKFCALTVGIPEPVDNDLVYMTKEKSGSQMQPVLTEKPGKNKRLKRGEVMSGAIQMKILATFRSQSNLALVDIATSTTKWDLLPIYLLEDLCCVLGEQIYSTRIKTILDQQILLARGAINEEVQALPEELVQRLRLPPHSTHSNVPMHLHCYQISLPTIGKGKKQLQTITAPLPDFFTRTLCALGINLPKFS